MGLRELKKEQTRQKISDLALALYFEKGFAAVTVQEVAAAAQVSPATVFNYYPTKEAMAFDREDELEAQVIAALKTGNTNESVLEVLYRYFSQSRLFNPESKRDYNRFVKLVTTTPELNSYFVRLWQRYARTLAVELQKAPHRMKKQEAECLARLVFEGVSFAWAAPQPKEAIDLTFRILTKGFQS